MFKYVTGDPPVFPSALSDLPKSNAQNRRLIDRMDRFSVLNPIEIVSGAHPYRLKPYEITLTPEDIPITKIAAQSDVFNAVDTIEQKIRPLLFQQLEYTLEETYRFITAFAELCQNIFYHSIQQGNHYGYIAVQAERTDLKFIAMDLGPGIPTTLRTKYTFGDDVEAVCKSCEAGITSRNRGGLGLFQTAQIVYQARGCMQIISGQARVLFSCKEPQAIPPPDPFTSDGYIWGTQVGILLPRKYN